MSYDFVGLENLPNTYIEKIKLRNGDENHFNADVSLLLLDEIYQNYYIWSEDPIIFDYLKIAVIMTTNQKLISEISSGKTSAHPYHLSKLMRSGDTHIQIVSPKECILTYDSNSRRYSKTVNFKVPSQADRATLFALTYLNSKELSRDLEVTLTGPLSNYHGSVTSENIIINGSTERSTFVYRDQSGVVWPGPVHQMPNGRFMGGSYHLGLSPLLTREVVSNSKIVDMRRGFFGDRLGFDINQRSLVSEMLTSFNNEADLIGTFSVDMRTMIMSKTKYGKKMFSVSPALFEEYSRSVETNSIEIRRQQVKFVRGVTKLGTPKYNKKLIGPYKTIAASVEKDNRLVDTNSLSQIFIVQDPLIKSYQFIDEEMTEKTRGEYRYELIITMIDKSSIFLRQLVSQMWKNISNLRVLKDSLFRPSKYDRQNNRLFDNVTVPDIFNESVVNYYDNLSLISNIDEETKKELIESRKKSLNKENYTNKEAETFIFEYQSLATKIASKFDIQNEVMRFDTSGNTKKTVSKGLVSTRHEFENVIKFDKTSATYDYLGVSSNKKLASFTKEEYQKRGNLEVSRFFDTTKAVSSSDLSNLDEQDAISIKDLSVSKVGFFSPLSFTFNGRSKDLTSLSDLDTDGISENFVSHMSKRNLEVSFSSMAKKKHNKPGKKSSPVKNRKSLRKRKVGRSKFKFKKIPIKINNLIQEKYVDVSKYLGDNSEMNNVDNNLVDPSKTPQSKQVERKLSITTEISAKRNKKTFDLRSKNNSYEKFKSSKAYNPERLRSLPVSIKSILNSRSSAAKNNILESESDILKDSETKVISEMMFYSTQKVQYFSEFEKDIYGLPDVSNPKWEDVTPISLENNSRLLCKMSYLEAPELDIKPAQEFKLQPLNSTFLISNESLSDKVAIENIASEALELSLELPEVDDIVFASSNLIKQSDSRKIIPSKNDVMGDGNGKNNRYR